eukprot:SAG22_NODE_948_length_6363_cov_1.935664_5_plen_297_part_00
MSADAVGELRCKFRASGTSIRRAFSSFDSQGDGYLSAAEFRRGLDGMDARLTAREVDALLGHLDRDGDGRISFGEFRREFDDDEPASFDRDRDRDRGGYGGGGGGGYGGGDVRGSAEDFLSKGVRRSEGGGGGSASWNKTDRFLRRKLDRDWPRRCSTRHRAALRLRHGKAGNDGKLWHRQRHTKFLRGMDVTRIKQLFAAEARGSSLSYGDFKELIKKVGVPNERIARGLFEGFDTDSSGGLDIHEFLTGFQVNNSCFSYPTTLAACCLSSLASRAAPRFLAVCSSVRFLTDSGL